MKLRNEFATSLVVAYMFVALGFTSAAAQENPDQESAQQPAAGSMPPQEPVAYRRHVKNAMQEHLAAFGLILMFRAPHEDQFGMHADALASLARAHEVLYPVGSETAGTSPLIWEQPETFAEAASKTTAAADRLRESLDSKNRHYVLNAFVRLSDSCEGCHARFRVSE